MILSNTGDICKICGKDVWLFTTHSFTNYKTRDEVRDANGNVKGSYNYIDINGVPQTVQYIADANGFQVQGTTVQVDNGQAPAPVEDTPEVAAAKVAHLK